MKKNLFFILLFLIGFSALAQIKGVVKDSITNLPIPYVNISIANENKGTTSEENGEFVIHDNDKNKKLIFSALGFEKKSITILNATTVYLKPSAVALDEVVIVKKYGTKQMEIGNGENDMFEAFDNGPRIDTKFFPYSSKYKKTRFIKQVSIRTDSRIYEATFKLHFYSVDANGFPGDELLDKDFIVSVGKGVKLTKFNLMKYNLQMPKNGIFVGFEKLIIEKNQYERSVFPLVLYNAIEKDFLFTYSGGKWIRQTKQNNGTTTEKIMIYEPAINLILTN